METTSEISTPIPAASEKKFFPLDFRGDGVEYTKLVLVNLALSIITLGLFSAWAKVRTKKYVYGNTYINGSNFNYHADPLQILKGRLIIGALFLVYGLGGKLSIFLPIAAGLIFVVALPWLLVQGMSFNMTNTSYRNIRFGFKKDFAEAYKVIFLGYLVTIVTLGLGAPYLYYKFSQFRVDKTRFGQSYFKSRFTVGDFYNVYIKLLGCYFGAAIVGVIFIALFMVIGKDSTVLKGIGTVGGVGIIYGGILFGIAIFNAGMFNLVYKMSRVEEVQFQTSMNGLTLFKLYIQNILLGIVTLGFGIPYGLYRLIKYKTQSIALWTNAEQFDQFIAANSTDNTGSIADAAGDFWDFDVGF